MRLCDEVQTGDEVEVDMVNDVLTVLSTGKQYKLKSLGDVSGRNRGWGWGGEGGVFVRVCGWGWGLGFGDGGGWHGYLGMGLGGMAIILRAGDTWQSRLCGLLLRGRKPRLAWCTCHGFSALVALVRINCNCLSLRTGMLGGVAGRCIRHWHTPCTHPRPCRPPRRLAR